MHDLPRQGLLQQLHAHKVTGEHLEVLGKHAATEWGRGKHASLDEAVITTVKTARLSPEQVHRVIEFANTEAFSAEFRKESAAHRVVNFAGGPADASTILKRLNDGSGSVTRFKGASDYSSPPEEKRASAAGDEALAHLFSSDMTKTAEEETLNPYEAAIDTRDKLASLRDGLAAELGGLEVMYDDMRERLYFNVKQAALEGVPLSDVLAAWTSTSSGKEDHIKVAFTDVAPRLLEDGVFSSIEAMQSSVEKTASSRLVNRQHPLVTEFGDFCEVLSKLAETRATQDVVVETLAPIEALLKQAAKEAAAGGIIPTVARAWGKGVDHVAHGAGHLAEKLYNNTEAPGQTAKAVKGGVQILGKYIVPAVAAKGAYDQLSQNPLYQAASNAILPNMPGTMPYYGY